MATRTRRGDKPLEELSDRALRQRAARADKTLGEIDGLDPADVVRQGSADATIAKMRDAVEVAAAAESELARRDEDRQNADQRRNRLQAPFVGRAWQAAEDKRKRRAKRERVLTDVVRFAHPELRGAQLVGDRLSEEEFEELRTLVDRKRDRPNAVENSAPMTAEETSRYEALVGKCAGDEALFERKRREKKARQKMAEMKEERRVAGLPKRPIYAEPGSVSLPRYLFGWLLADENAGGEAWGITDLGMLATVLFAFENRQPEIFVGGRFEDEGELTLIIPGGIGSEIRLKNRAEGSSLDANGGVRVRPALATLARNQLIEVEWSVGDCRIRLGERAKALRSPEQRKTAST